MVKAFVYQFAISFSNLQTLIHFINISLFWQTNWNYQYVPTFVYAVRCGQMHNFANC